MKKRTKNIKAQAVGARPAATKPTGPASGSALLVTCFGDEDEMIFLHKGDEWTATLYASCPEQAKDFVMAHGRSKLASVEAWEKTLRSFKNGWKSEYPDED